MATSEPASGAALTPATPTSATAPARQRKPLGLVMLTALVVGNMIGSGVFLLPASLAPFGVASLGGWGISAAGACVLGLVFARLGRRSVAPGGLYAYTRDAFGECAAFLVGWGYWVSCWCTLAALAVAMVGYLGALVPGLKAPPPVAVGVAVAAIALLTAINIRGVAQAGRLQVVTTALKLVPLLALALLGWSGFRAAHLEPRLLPDASPLAAVHASVTLTLWAFLGLESAGISAGEAREPRRDVPRATLLGIAIAGALYVASTLAVMGVVPPETLATSTAPFAAAAEALWGGAAAKAVAAGAFISCLGALNGWTLVTGQLAMTIARDGLFPAGFARCGARGTPTLGLAVSGGLACVLVVAFYTESLVAMYNAMILLATLATLVTYVFCAMAELRFTLRARAAGAAEPIGAAVAVCALAYAFAVFAIAGAGAQTALYGLLLLLLGMPFYVLARARRS